jgi:hypothetical protein
MLNHKSQPPGLGIVMTMTLASNAEALFLSRLQPSDRPSADQVAAAIRISIVEHGGICGCIGDFAAAYGEQPELAAERMRWALSLVSHSQTARSTAA